MVKNNLKFSISQLVLLIIVSNRPIIIVSSIIYSSILILFFLFSILFHSIKVEVFHSMSLSFLLLVPFGLYFVLSFLLLSKAFSWVLFGVVLASSIPFIVLNSINSDKFKLLSCLYLIILFVLLSIIIIVFTGISDISLFLFIIGILLMISSLILMYFDDKYKIFHLLFHIIFILSIMLLFFFIVSLSI